MKSEDILRLFVRHAGSGSHRLGDEAIEEIARYMANHWNTLSVSARVTLFKVGGQLVEMQTEDSWSK